MFIGIALLVVGTAAVGPTRDPAKYRDHRIDVIVTTGEHTLESTADLVRFAVKQGLVPEQAPETLDVEATVE